MAELLSIGEFAKVSRLSIKALRLYDELELLTPEHVDRDSGYRYYTVEDHWVRMFAERTS